MRAACVWAPWHAGAHTLAPPRLPNRLGAQRGTEDGVGGGRLRRVVLPRHLRTLSVAARAGQGFGKDAPSSPTRSSSPPRTKPATNGATAPQDVAPLAAATEAVPATTVEAEVETTLVEGVPMQAIPAAPQELLYITVPPEPIEGVCQDCSEMDNDELVASDAVYNHVSPQLFAPIASPVPVLTGIKSHLAAELTLTARVSSFHRS